LYLRYRNHYILPLSFCTSVFSINAAELNDGLLLLATELRLMFPGSPGIIVASFLFALSRGVLTNSLGILVRSGLSFVWNTAVTWLVVRTKLYVAGRGILLRANQLREREGTVTRR
jgi:hypothetical protein